MGRHRSSERSTNCICTEICKHLKDMSREQCTTNKESNEHLHKVNIQNIQKGDENFIPYFNPDNNDVTVEQWTSNVDKIAKQFGWDDNSIMRLIIQRLQGNAKKWLETRHSIPISWAETKTMMINIFNKPLPFGKLIKEAVMHEAKVGQCLGDYCLEKINKWRKINIKIPDEYIIDYVIDGIKNMTIARSIRAARHTNVDEFYKYMQTMGHVPGKNVYPREAVAHTLQNRTNGRTNTLKNHKPGSKFINKYNKTKKQAQMDNSTVRCFHCGEDGHFARTCIKQEITTENDRQKYNKYLCKY